MQADFRDANKQTVRFDLLPAGDLLNCLGRTDRSTQGTGVFAVSVGHQQGRGPETGHTGFGKAGVDCVGGAGFHTETATLAAL